MEIISITIALLIISFLFLLAVQIGTIRVNRARFDSLKGRIAKMDEHLHGLIEDLKDKNHESFDWYLSLMGYKRIDVNHKEGLVLAEDIDGNIFIAERFTSPLVFVPVKEKKIKNGTRQVEYAGKMLEFESQTAKDF